MRSTRAPWYLLALAAACAPIPAPPAPLQSPLEWHGRMAERNSYAITGTGYVQNRYGRIMVMLMLANGEPGQVLPWHLHHGTCGRGAEDVVGPESAYRPVTIQADGSATGSAEVHGFQLYPEARYHVDVHSSAYQEEGIVACANLAPRPLGSSSPRPPAAPAPTTSRHDRLHGSTES